MPEHGILGAPINRQPQKRVGLFDRIVSGTADQRLSQEQNQQTAKDARLQAGLAMLMASQSGPGMEAPGLLQILGQGMVSGRQGAGMARQGMAQQQALQQALQQSGLDPQTLAQLQALPPEQQAEALKELMTRPNQVVSRGQQLVSPTGELLFAGAEQGIDLPADMRALAFGMGFDLTKPLSNEQKTALLQEWVRINTTPRNQTTVNLGETGELSPTVQRQYDRFVENAVNSINSLSDLRAMEQLIQAGASTGAKQAMLLPLRQLGIGWGIWGSEEEASQVGLQEAFRAISDRMTLGLAEQLTGPKSDNDIKFLQSQVPQLSNTQGGNMILIETLRRMEEGRLALAQHMTRYFAENGERGWLQELQRYTNENQLDFSDLVETVRWLQNREKERGN